TRPLLRLLSPCGLGFVSSSPPTPHRGNWKSRRLCRCCPRVSPIWRHCDVADLSAPSIAYQHTANTWDPGAEGASPPAPQMSDGSRVVCSTARQGHLMCP